MADFISRFTAVEAELHALYNSLYHDENAWQYFVSMLTKMAAERKETLQALDDAREANPAWYRDQSMLGMLMYTQCYGGTLKGIQDKLDYLKETGVNYVHLMPLLESPKGRSDGGYAVADFRKVQPALGTMEDLADLADACHADNMALCLDFVMNHTSEDHIWAQQARAGDPSAQAKYFFYDSWDIPNLYERTVPQVFPTTAPGNFSWCEEAKKVVMTTFYPYQWDLNYANPMVFNDMTENMLFLCNQGVDIIRLDAVPYIWKELWTPCRNLPQVHTLVRMMRLACEAVCPGTLMLGEVVMEPSKVVPYFGSVEKPECHMLYNVTTMASTWHTVATQDVRLLRRQLDSVCALPNVYTFLNYLRCHDDIGWGLDYDFLKWFGAEEVAHKKFLNDYFTGEYPGSISKGELYNNDPRLGDARLCGTTASLCGIETAEAEQDAAKLETALRKHVMLHAFLLTQSGIPVLYSGDEIGMCNDNTYHADEEKQVDSRYLHRGKLDWNEVAQRTDAASRPGRIFAALAELVKLRREKKVFNADADVWTLDTGSDAVLGIGRYFDGEKLLAYFNFSSQPQTVAPKQDEVYTDLLTGETVNQDGVTLAPGGFLWMVTEF